MTLWLIPAFANNPPKGKASGKEAFAIVVECRRSSRNALVFDTRPDPLFAEIEQDRRHEQIDHHLPADPLSLVE